MLKQPINALRDGAAEVSFRPRGRSMEPTIRSGQLCTVVRCNRELVVGDVVLCVVRGERYLHRISAIESDRYEISNNLGRVNGWVSINKIYGVLARVED